MYTKKEHKVLSLFFNLHVEYSKQQVLGFLYLSCVLQLALCQIYITYLNWDFEKNYTNSQLCIWGCNYEAQIFGGFVCAILPWPLVYTVKYLLARNLTNLEWSEELQ